MSRWGWIFGACVFTGMAGAQPEWTGEYLVQFAPNVSDESLLRVRSLGALQASRSQAGGVVKLRPSASTHRSMSSLLAEIRALPGVLHAEPNYVFRSTQTTDPLMAQQWGLGKIRVPQVWNSVLGLGVIVAVVDTGIDTGHPEFSGRIAGGSNFTGGSSGDFQDRNGHGTHVAGIVGAAWGNGQGGAGVAPNVQLLAVKVLNDQGAGTTDTVMAGIQYAVDQGARVINLSLGGTGQSTLLANAIRQAVQRGALVVGAAGNSGSTTESYPGAQPEVLCVGATQSNDARASFSNHGPWVDVAAPGTSIWSTLPSGQYGQLQGTSMATPFVAGQAALVWQHLGLSATPAQVRARIEESARPIGSWVQKGLVQVPESLTTQATPTVTQTTHFATTVRTTTGSNQSSLLALLQSADDQRFRIRSSTGSRQRPAGMWVTLPFNPRVPNEGGTVVLNLEAVASTQVLAQLYFFDPLARQWRSQRSIRLGTTESQLELPISNLTKWLSNGSFQIALSASNSRVTSFELSLDLARVTSSDAAPLP